MTSPTTCVWKATPLHYRSDKLESHPSKFYCVKYNSHEVCFVMWLLFSQQHPSLRVVTLQHYTSQKWNSQIWSAGWVTTALYARCTIFGDLWVCIQSHCRIWRKRCIHMAQLEGQETKHAVKTGCLRKLQSCKSPDLQVLIYAVVQPSEKYMF